jgi:hypothetical protein
VEACAGLSVWPGGDHECLWITGLASLKSSPGGDHTGLRGGSLGKHGPGRAEEQGWKIRDPMVCGAAALWAYGAGLSIQHCLFF